MTSRDKKNLYEGMFVINAGLSDELRQKTFNKLEEMITEKGGEIHKIHQMGKKRLAYDIAGHRDGYYQLIYFSVDPAAIKQIWHDCHLNEELLRFMTLRAEKVAETLEYRQLVEQ